VPGILLFGLILFDMIEGRKYIGGPAINIALHMAYHGEIPTLISCVGNDELGEITKRLLVDNKISTAYIKTDDQHETGKGIVSLDNKGNPTFELVQPVAYDFITLTDQQIEELAKIQFDILYFGTVVQRTDVSRETLRKVLSSISYKHCFFDINLRKGLYTKEIVNFSLLHTDIFKLNDQELLDLAIIFELGASEEKSIIDWVFAEYPIKIILVTRGENGGTVFTRDEMYEINGIKVDVKDTVGSGDAFSAGFIMEYMKSGDLLLAAQKGNELGAYVASKSGAVPEINEQ
jgi:fructokinase